MIIKKKKRVRNNIKQSIKKYINKSKKKSNIYNGVGGKFLGKGSFGCVITPAIKCKKSNKNNKKMNVSKIILNPDNSIDDEINILNILKKIDPEQKYFISLKDHCKLKSIPKDRSNIARSKFISSFMNNSSSNNNFKILNTKKLNTHFCPVDLNTQPINFIMDYAGYDLVDIAEILDKYNQYNNISFDSILKNKSLNIISKHKILTAKYVFIELKNNIKNLLQGLLLLHKNNIVNRDIKDVNIMINYDNNNKLFMRYIDFGLSEHLTEDYITHFYNINNQGTSDLISPDLYVIFNLNKYNTSENDTFIIKKINKYITNYNKKMFRKVGLPTNKFNNIIKFLYYKYKPIINKKELLNIYFGSNNILNGLLQKNDIYSLGLTLLEFLNKYTKIINLFTPPHIKLLNLLKNMVEINPDKRYNALQCLQHPYFL